jgi:hypothetical protein
MACIHIEQVHIADSAQPLVFSFLLVEPTFGKK